MAIRMALGGSRGRLVRQLLLEGGVLSVAAVAGGLLLSRWLVLGVSPWLLPTLANYSMFPELTVDSRVVAFSLFCGVATALGASLLPSLAATRTDLLSLLKRAPVHLGRRYRLAARDALVVAQLVVTFAFLAAASLCVQGIRQALSAPFGFMPEHLLTVTFFLGPEARRSSGAFLDAAMAATSSIPGVKRVTLAAAAPGAESRIVARLPGNQDGGSRLLQVLHNQVRPEFFEVTGARLRTGRFFDESDLRGNQRVALVSAEMARRLWGAEDPVGRPLVVGSDDGQVVEVVGVTDNPLELAAIDQLPGARAEPFLLLPLNAEACAKAGPLTMLVEGHGDAARLAPQVELLLRSRSPDIGVGQIATVAALNRRGLIQYELASTFLGLLGAVCAVLGSVGLYATIACAVEKRTREIGVRVALGASGANVVRTVLGSGLLLASLGVTLGIPASFAAERMLRHGIFGLPGLGAGTLTALAALVTFIALVASYVPARRAARVDPAIALRCE
jgi:predicted permease